MQVLPNCTSWKHVETLRMMFLERVQFACWYNTTSLSLSTMESCFRFLRQVVRDYDYGRRLLLFCLVSHSLFHRVDWSFVFLRTTTYTTAFRARSRLVSKNGVKIRFGIPNPRGVPRRIHLSSPKYCLLPRTLQFFPFQHAGDECIIVPRI